MRVDNVTRGEFEELKREIRQDRRKTPLNNSGMGRGELFVDGGTITIANGGTLNVTGLLKGLGSFLWDGIVTLTSTFTAQGTTRFEGDTTQVGPFHVTGAANINGTLAVNGATDINSTLAVKGATTLTSNMTVTAPGKITVGGTIPMTLGDAKVSFTSGGSLIGYTNGIRVASGGTPDVVVSTGGVSLTGSAAQYLTVSGGGHFLGGAFTTTSAANVFIDSTSGAVSRVTSAARFKIDPQPMTLPDSLLAVPVKDWIDRAAHERGEDGPRVPGIIAEEVEAAGGESFVTYDGDGLIQGVSYDRLALARTEILARQLAAALGRIELLEAKLAG